MSVLLLRLDFHFRNRVEVLKLLIEKRVDLNSQTDCKKTALHIAVCNQFAKSSRLLIDGGCYANLQVI